MLQILIDVEFPDDAVTRLREIPGVAVEKLPPPHQFRALPAEQLRGVHLYLTKLPPVNFEDLQSLQVLQLATVGYEHLRHLNLAERPFAVCNARGIFDTAIAEWNLAMMINLARAVPDMIRHQDEGRWQREPRYTGEIRRATVGLWGYGGIGRETARLAKAFGMRVHVLTRQPVGPRGDNYAPPGTGDPDGTLPDRRFTAGSERDFLSELDFLVLALPRTRQTDGRIGEVELRALPRTAFVLNPARGAIVQEAALQRALAEKWIAGAVLDTHATEPLPADSPLWRAPGVIVTPHISGSDRAARFPARIADLFVRNVQRFRASQPLLNRLGAAELNEM